MKSEEHVKAPDKSKEKMNSSPFYSQSQYFELNEDFCKVGVETSLKRLQSDLKMAGDEKNTRLQDQKIQTFID